MALRQLYDAKFRHPSDYDEDIRKQQRAARSAAQSEQAATQDLELGAFNLNRMRKQLADSKRLGEIMAENADPATTERKILSELGPEPAMEYRKYAQSQKQAQRTEALENVTLMQGRPGVSPQVPMAPTQERPIGTSLEDPSKIGPRPAPVTPPGVRTIEAVAAPHRPITVPSVTGGQDMTMTPYTQQQLDLRAEEAAQAEAARSIQKKATELELTRAANQYTITDPTTGRRVTAPKDLLDNLLSQSAQNQRNSDSLAQAAQFHRDEMNQRELDRRARLQAASQSSRPPTAAMLRTFGFYMRAKDSVNTLESIEKDIQDLGLVDQVWQRYAPNFAQTQLGQIYEQAQRQFTEARLRKDSGAAIPLHEYENDRRTYFVQPGDTPKTLERKRAARALLIRSLQNESGRAYTESFPEEPGSGLDEATIQANMRANPTMTRQQVIDELSKE